MYALYFIFHLGLIPRAILFLCDLKLLHCFEDLLASFILINFN